MDILACVREHKTTRPIKAGMALVQICGNAMFFYHSDGVTRTMHDVILVREQKMIF